MAKHWSSALLSLSAAALLLLASCQKNTYSKDDPLPASYGPSVVINSDNQVMYAVDPSSGKKNWERSFAYLPQVTNTHYTPSPVVYNGSVYMAAANSDTLYKINSRTGAITNRLYTSVSYRSIATPIIDAGVIYVATLSGYLVAVDTNGTVKWSFNGNAPFESSPTISKTQVYAATTGGHIFSIDKSAGPDPITGVPTWDYPGAGVTLTFQPKFVSSVTVGDPYVYVGSVSDSSMYCIYITPPTDPALGIPANTGYLRWTYKTSGPIYSSPAAYAGYCIFGSTDYYVYCLDSSIHPNDPISPTTSPKPVWKYRTNSQILSSPLAYNQVIYIGSNDQNLYALRVIDGSVKWTCNTNGLVKSSPSAYGSLIYIGSYDKNLYAIDSSSGSVKWTWNTNGPIECSPTVDNLTALTGFNSQVSGYTY